MNRTYQCTIDNGLFFLSEVLNKNYKDITLEDIEQSTDIISSMVEKYRKYERYKDILKNGFYNSSIQNCSIRTKEQIKRNLDTFFENVNKDETGETCMFCGHKFVNAFRTKGFEKKPTRSHIPNISSTTFSNYINNLQVVNVCPVCLYLSILSSFVSELNGNRVLLFMSDNDEVMEDIAYNAKMTLETRLSNLNDYKIINSIDFLYNNIIKLLEIESIYENGYITFYSFYNPAKGNPITEENIISNKDLNFIRRIMEKSLLSEFKLKKQFYYMIIGRLQKDYISCVFDFHKEELRVSKELFDEIEEVYNRLNKDKLQLIKDICKKVYNTNDKDEISQLKNINNLSQFEELLLKWNEIYIKKNEENLFTNIEEYNSLCDYKEFKITRNTMLMQFMLLNK